MSTSVAFLLASGVQTRGPAQKPQPRVRVSAMRTAQACRHSRMVQTRATLQQFHPHEVQLFAQRAAPHLKGCILLQQQKCPFKKKEKDHPAFLGQLMALMGTQTRAHCPWQGQGPALGRRKAGEGAMPPAPWPGRGTLPEAGPGQLLAFSGKVSVLSESCLCTGTAC